MNSQFAPALKKTFNFCKRSTTWKIMVFFGLFYLYACILILSEYGFLYVALFK